jgi:hypothetical protein
MDGQSHVYVEPNLHIHVTLKEAEKFVDAGPSYFWGEKGSVGIQEIAEGKRNLVIGEPGVGKTELLSRLHAFFDARDVPNKLIPLRDQKALSLIDQYVSESRGKDFTLILDGLDEVQGNLFPLFLEKIENISKAEPQAGIFISSRSIFMKRHRTSFPDYRVITLSPFTRGQVREYLIAAGHAESEIDAFLGRLMSFSHNLLVVQIPRYLSYVTDLLKERNIASVSQISRNELFEYFIYKKLYLEEEKQSETGLTAITKRLLEKIALTMEIYQANTISRDELMTFFDELESDLKLVAVSQLNLQVLFEKSLLKDNHDSIEFQNTEFQEYLAAKEITRFGDPKWTAFTLSVQHSIGEIHPSWLNALTFLVDMHPDLLEPLIEFSGLRGTKVIDEGFITFLSRIESHKIRSDLRSKLFTDLLRYYDRALQWIPLNLASFLPSMYSPPLESMLKTGLVSFEKEADYKRYIPLGNIALVIGHLLEVQAQVDKEYWRKELLRLAADHNENGVLQRYAIFALEKLKDSSVIDELPLELTQSSDELIMRAVLTLCTNVAPDSSRSMSLFFDATRKGEIHGRYGLYALKARNALKTFLETLHTDSTLLRGFLDKASIFKDQDQTIVEHIRAVCDTEITELCKQVIVNSFDVSFVHEAERSVFIRELGRLVKEKLKDFFSVMIESIRTQYGSSGLFFTRSFFAHLLEKEDIPSYLSSMMKIGEHGIAFGVMQSIRLSSKPNAHEMFDAGRPFLLKYYEQWDNERSSPDSHESEFQKRKLDEFKLLLEPLPKKYDLSVFGFCLDHLKELDPIISVEDKSRLADLITGSVFKNIDPLKYDLTAATPQPGPVLSYSVSSNISLFGEALRVAEHLSVDLTQFRQQIINYIPFAYSDHLRSIFKVIGKLQPSEITPVVDIYKQHKSDLWRHMPGNLVDAVEQYHLVDVVPVLKTFAKEPAFPAYVRERALTVAESLIADKSFLDDVVVSYENATDPNDKSVSTTATNLLITGHSDKNAIKRKLEMIIKYASPFKQVKGVHPVGPLEEEILGSNSFAKPLMELKTRGFEQDFLELLDTASRVWAKGKNYYPYATYLWNIVYAYFDNLKEHGSFEPLKLLEKKLAMIQNKDGSNWLLARMTQLRRSYLAYLGKPQNIAQAILQYNQARKHDNKKILNSEELHYQLKEAIDTDLTEWIQAEGAYDLLLSGRVYQNKRQQFEKLVQKTLKSQIEIILLKRHFQVDVLREPQLLDEKRTDFLVRYGFVGPIVIEVKLTSNSDMKMSVLEQSPSFKSMEQYMRGYGASHGIFLVIDNVGAENLQKIRDAFTKIPTVWVKVFDYKTSIPRKARKARKKSGKQKHK